MEQMDKQQVLHSLSMTDCIRLMRTVLREHAQGKGQQYLRTVTCLPGNDLFGFMPAHLGAGDYFGAKVITVFPGNHQVGLPSHQGSVLLFDAQHGTLQFMADGDAITQIRKGPLRQERAQMIRQFPAGPARRRTPGPSGGRGTGPLPSGSYCPDSAADRCRRVGCTPGKRAKIRR